MMAVESNISEEDSKWTLPSYCSGCSNMDNECECSESEY